LQDIENIFQAFTASDFVKNREATVVVGPLYGYLSVFDAIKMGSICRVKDLSLRYLTEKNGESNFFISCR